VDDARSTSSRKRDTALEVEEEAAAAAEEEEAPWGGTPLVDAMTRRDETRRPR
jgi:hypothetical protein